MRKLWPRCSYFLFNTYQGLAPLFLNGTDVLLYSREGTTQGDPLAMLFYGVSLMPLIRELRNPSCNTQCWYADDSGSIGELRNVYLWLQHLVKEGPKYGYFPEPDKSYLIIKESFREEAQHLYRASVSGFLYWRSYGERDICEGKCYRVGEVY
jgi:hypothetical protein